MNKILSLICVLLGGIALTACSNDDDDAFLTIRHDGVQVTFKNFDKWIEATQQVGTQLQAKADSLIQQWTQAEVQKFIESGSVEEIINGCAAAARMPGENFTASIRNSYFGSIDGTVAEASLANLTAALAPDLDREIRSNIASVENAQLESLFAEKLAPIYAQLSGYDNELMAVRATYVKAVALPTLANLKAKTIALYQAIQTLAASPSDATYAALSQAWADLDQAWQLSSAIAAGPFAFPNLPAPQN